MQNCRRKSSDKIVSPCTDRWMDGRTAMAIPVCPPLLRYGVYKDLSKLNTFADHNFSVPHVMKFFFGRVENNCVKRRICWFAALSSFSKRHIFHSGYCG